MELKISSEFARLLKDKTFIHLRKDKKTSYCGEKNGKKDKVVGPEYKIKNGEMICLSCDFARINIKVSNEDNI